MELSTGCCESLIGSFVNAWHSTVVETVPDISSGVGDQFGVALLEGSATPECLSELCSRLGRCC